MPEALDARERRELCDLLEEVGPDAPTLCEGWTTFDLAAHLAVRERDLRAAPGILLGGRFEPMLVRLMERAKERGRKKLYLDTAKDHPWLPDMYRRWGCKEIGTIRWPGQNFDAVQFEIEL